MAVAKGPDEYEVKAAFLYNFALYVDWPDKASSGDGSFVIGILGDDPFGDALDAIAGEKSVRGRRIEVLRFRSLDEYRDCDILFVSSAQSPSAERLLQIAGSGGALIVGEERGFARHGGMINFFIEDSRVRFEINPEAASAAGLSISSKLLRLASIVGADGREG